MSEAFADRLRRLRRDAPAAKPSPGERAGPRSADPTGDGTPLGGDVALEVGPPAGLAVASGERGEFAFRETRWRARHVHGEWRLDEVDHADPETLGLVARDPSCAAIDLRDAVYLDIETTGLSGGAGTVPFLVALGRFEGDEFVLWQGFVRHPGEEPALLAETARRVGDAGGVVSFFGKSFDRHRLEDKMRLHRVEPSFEGRPHLDLYWAFARLYGGGLLRGVPGALDDGRLATCERELCGLRREDDLPGSRAPEAWFDFLAGRGHRLEAVFAHNRDDVLSLVTLAAHAGRTLTESRGDGAPLPGSAVARAVGVGRLLARAGDRERALGWLESGLARGLEGDPGGTPERDRPPAEARWHREVALERADLLRAGRRDDEALAALLGLTAGEDEVGVRAGLAAAKLLEHRRRDPASALERCREARRVARRVLTGPAYARVVRDLDRREPRLAARAVRER